MIAATGFQGESGAGGPESEKTLAELGRRFDVHPDRITQLKGQLLEGVAGVFGQEKSEAGAAPVGI